LPKRIPQLLVSALQTVLNFIDGGNFVLLDIG